MQLEFLNCRSNEHPVVPLRLEPLVPMVTQISPRLAAPATLWILGSKSRLLGRALRLLVVAGGDPNGASSGQADRETRREAQNQKLRVHTRPRAKSSKNE